MISVEKPGSPSEVLEHVGVKGMKWGVRKAVVKVAGTPGAQREHRKKVAKRVAIGVGVTAVVIGGAFVAYKLHQNRQIKLNSIRQTPEISRGLFESEKILRSGRAEVDRIHDIQKAKRLAAHRIAGTSAWPKVGTPEWIEARDALNIEIMKNWKKS